MRSYFDFKDLLQLEMKAMVGQRRQVGMTTDRTMWSSRHAGPRRGLRAKWQT